MLEGHWVEKVKFSLQVRILNCGRILNIGRIFELTSRNFEILSRIFELFSRNFEIPYKIKKKYVPGPNILPYLIEACS